MDNMTSGNMTFWYFLAIQDDPLPSCSWNDGLRPWCDFMENPMENPYNPWNSEQSNGWLGGTSILKYLYIYNCLYILYIYILYIILYIYIYYILYIIYIYIIYQSVRLFFSLMSRDWSWVIRVVPRLAVASLRSFSRGIDPISDCVEPPSGHDYPLVNQHSYGKSPFLMGKSTINVVFSIAMLNYQRVTVCHGIDDP